jgi:hypothetical protein
LKLGELSATPLLDRRTERLSIEGYVQRLSGDTRLWLPGIELDRQSLERHADQPRLAERLRVTGRRDVSGRLRVERIRTIDRPTRRPDLDRIRPTTHSKPSKPNKALKRGKPLRASDRPPRPKPPRPDRPPRIDRPNKPDRPTTIDRALRDAKKLN